MNIYVQTNGQQLGPSTKPKPKQGGNASGFALFLLSIILLVWPTIADAQQTAQEWQAEATKKFPQLTVKDSPFNRVFLAAYGVLKSQSSKSLNSPEIFYLLAIATSQVLADSTNTTPDSSALGKAAANKIPELQTIIAKVDSGSFVAGAEIKEIDPEGALCSTYTTKSIVHEEDHVEQSQTMLGPGMVSHHKTKTVEVQKTPVSDSVFIAGIHKVAPNQEWTGKIWPAGTFDFHSAAGHPKRIERWTVARNDAIKICLHDEESKTNHPAKPETTIVATNLKQEPDDQRGLGSNPPGPFIHIDPKRLLGFLHDIKMDGGRINVEYSSKYKSTVCRTSFGIYFIAEFVGPSDATTSVHVVATWNNGALSNKLSAHDDSISIFITEILHICNMDASDWLIDQFDAKQGYGMHKSEKSGGTSTISAVVNIAENADETVRLEYTILPDRKGPTPAQ